MGCARCKNASSIDSIDKELEWHKILGHPSSERFIKLMIMGTDLPNFSNKTINSILFHPCEISKSKRATPKRSTRVTTRPLELIHLDIMGPMTRK